MQLARHEALTPKLIPTYLERHDDPSEVGLVLLPVVDVLRVQDVMHRHQVPVLRKRSGPHPPQLLHVTPYPNDQPEVHAESPHVRACLTAGPEDP